MLEKLDTVTSHPLSKVATWAFRVSGLLALALVSYFGMSALSAGIVGIGIGLTSAALVMALMMLRLREAMPIAAIILVVGGAFILGTLRPASYPETAYVQGMRGTSVPRFNSLTGVPDFPDERLFLSGKLLGGHEGGFYDPMAFTEIGDVLLVRTYVHNNGDGALNGDNREGPTVAHDVRVVFEVPEEPGTELVIESTISASDSDPRSISDTLTIRSDTPFRLQPVPGSATVLTNAMDVALSDEIWSGDGHLIGYDQLDGVIPGCFQYVSLVTFEVEVQAP